MDPPEEHPPITRLAPDVLLPPYSYVTGHYPHPFRDPQGHSRGCDIDLPPAVDPQHWQESDAYRYGIDLFNYSYYWEAHESWEGLWHACGRAGPIGEMLKGLIKLAAAGVKARERRPAGVQRHATRAAEIFRKLIITTDPPRLLGLDLDFLESAARKLAASPPRPATVPKPPPVEVLFDFQLRPS